jgi:hypothetical protein
MPLSALDLLASIVSSLLSAHPGRFNRLAIYDARARLRLSLETNPHPLAQGLMHPFPGSIDSPETEVVMDSLYANVKKDGEDPPVKWELRSGSPLPRR